MADVTISQLTQGTPSGNHLLPYSTGSDTLGTPVSAIFQSVSSRIGINGIANSSNPGLQVNNGSVFISSSGGNQLNISSGPQRWDLDVDVSANNALRIRNMTYPAGVTSTAFSIASAGYVTTPYQAGFKATITSGTISTGQTVLWNSVEYQTPDNSFNTSTGEWTAPQTGRYLVCIGLLSPRNGTVGDWYVDLNVNNTVATGGRFYTARSGTGNVHVQVNGSGIFKLNAGDKIKTILTSGIGDVIVSSFHNLFCAELLG
jgi:hypothetical protein